MLCNLMFNGFLQVYVFSKEDFPLCFHQWKLMITAVFHLKEENFASSQISKLVISKIKLKLAFSYWWQTLGWKRSHVKFYMQLWPRMKGTTFVTFDYLFLQKIPIPILIHFLLWNLERSLRLITFHNIS